jgi:hypothetical protein
MVYFSSGVLRGGLRVQTAPRNSKVLTELSRIPSSVENTQSNMYTGFTHLQIERNP